MSTTTQSLPAIALEWDNVRSAFAASIMVDTALSSLAQNLDGLEWPFAGDDETPSAYIDYQYPELLAEFTNRGKPEAATLLVQILRETLDFDQPFGEMVKQTEAFAEKENPHLKAMARLELPQSFPLELTSLDESARQLCRLESVATLGEFALFAQRLSQGVIVGGDLRRLLNSLAHSDERTLSELLPFRPGSTGLHFFESLVQSARSKDAAERVMGAVAWFNPEFLEWQKQAKLDRKFIAQKLSSLRNPELEKRIAQLLAPHLDLEEERPSFWSSLRRLFKR
jgi:hypothetical protein